MEFFDVIKIEKNKKQILTFHPWLSSACKLLEDESNFLIISILPLPAANIRAVFLVRVVASTVAPCSINCVTTSKHLEAGDVDSGQLHAAIKTVYLSRIIILVVY